MKTQYTPGPWIVDENIVINGVAYIGVRIPNSTKVIAVTGFKCAGDEESSKADATLIAAVHDMLAALVDCRRALEIANCTQELSIVDAAIAKASGE